MNYKLISLAALLGLASTAVAQTDAFRMVGGTYASVNAGAITYDLDGDEYSDDPDGWATGLELNYNAYAYKNFGLDLNFAYDYQYADSTAAWGTSRYKEEYDGHSITFQPRVYMELASYNTRVYVAPLIGQGWYSAEVTHRYVTNTIEGPVEVTNVTKYDNDDSFYGGSIGAETNISEDMVVRASGTFVRMDGDEQWTLSAGGAYRFTPSLAAGATLAWSTGDSDDQLYVGGSFTYIFW